MLRPTPLCVRNNQQEAKVRQQSFIKGDEFMWLSSAIPLALQFYIPAMGNKYPPIILHEDGVCQCPGR